MTPTVRRFPPALLAWFGVWAFWLATTWKFHPTVVLAVIVTTSLVAAYAGAATLHHRVLLPRLRAGGGYWRYVGSLGLVMTSGSALALGFIRAAYRVLAGPDPDPHGVYKHFFIDLFGMAVHLLAAAAVVRVVERARRGRGPRDEVAEKSRGTSPVEHD